MDRYANLHTINVTQCSALTLSLSISISTATNRITNSGFSFDAAGELLTDGFGGTFTWNAEGRMAATAGYTYTYDGDGQKRGQPIKTGKNGGKNGDGLNCANYLSDSPV